MTTTLAAGFATFTTTKRTFCSTSERPASLISASSIPASQSSFLRSPDRIGGAFSKKICFVFAGIRNLSLIHI